MCVWGGGGGGGGVEGGARVSDLFYKESKSKIKKKILGGVGWGLGLVCVCVAGWGVLE